MNLSLKQYKAIDLGLIMLILAVSEVLIARAARVWFPQEVYALSPTLTVVTIVLMRWGKSAAVHAAGGGLAMCLALGADVKQMIVYCAGTCLALAALLMFRRWDKEQVRNSSLLTLMFTLAAYISAQLGRWLVMLIFGGTVGDLVKLFAADSLTLLFTLVAVQLARRIDGLFEDQLHYLIRTQSERRRQQADDTGCGDVQM
ncbi:hypothetical protein [Ruminococcus sp.]|uniref:hypothetical protein n=1 Tax=Ruminococcus sp. TaxID=41978 RepID=UPI0025E541E2|nr:hypothetical protein [Ruminococcus sp.]MBQ8967408.1 hypothetical protein [Ruminococcus sp.]